MCQEFPKENIIDTIYKLEEAKTNYFHIDVMDGEFVKNNTHDIMLEYAEYLDHVTKVPLDVHLMVKDIKNYVDSYLIFNPNIITFHYEACKDKEEVFEIIKYIKEKGRRVGISIKPNTKLEEIKEFLPYVHLVLIMTVEPGLYIPGWGGVRLEDQGIITKDGYENLISATHELIEL